MPRLPHAQLAAAKAEWTRRYGGTPWPLDPLPRFGLRRTPTANSIAEAEALFDAAWLGAPVSGVEFSEVAPTSPLVFARASLVQACFGSSLLDNGWKIDWAAWRSVPRAPRVPYQFTDVQAAEIVAQVSASPRLPQPTNNTEDVQTLTMTAKGGSRARIFTQIQIGAWGQNFPGINWGNVDGVGALMRGYLGPMSYGTWLSNVINMRNLLRKQPDWTDRMEREWARTIAEMAVEYRHHFQGEEW